MMGATRVAFGLALIATVAGGGPTCAQIAEPRWPRDAQASAAAQPDPARPGTFVIDLDRPDIPVSSRERIIAVRSVPPAEAQAFMADQTRMSYDPQHGTQVSYGARDGRTFLWYPGNSVVLQGEWRIATRTTEIKLDGRVLKTRSEPSICFRYGQNTYNPATRQAGGNWECGPFEIRRRLLREARRGDVFGLAKAAVPPTLLGREPTTISELLRRARAAGVGR